MKKNGSHDGHPAGAKEIHKGYHDGHPASNKEKLVTALSVPQDLAYRDAILTVTGRNLAVIENYRGILRYTREEIIVLTFGGRLTICGKHLEIPCFTREEMQIRGCISRIFLEQ